MKYRELFASGRAYLAAHGVPEADTDAWLLFEYVTGIDRAHYFLKQEDICDSDWRSAYERLVRERAKRIPLQHLTGQQEFMGFSFRVNRDVLIPRQDTELLVTEALKRVQKDSDVLDMCTGSGCIAISLQKLTNAATENSVKNGRYRAVDLSEEALAVAEDNAKHLGADVKFIRSDLFEKVTGVYDCIVSNPPYIRSTEIPGLMPEVAEHEPVLALDGKEDGLYFYRKITEEAGRYLKRGGWLLFEIGFDQGEEVSRLLKEQGYTEIEVKKDLAGLDRVVVGRWQ